MCIAIVKPQGTIISDEYLENCFNNNRDGAGIAYAKDGQLYIVKGIFNLKNFLKIVRQIEEIAQGDMLIHCRIRTSGLKDKNNCHPHKVNNNLVMIHNGILNIEIPHNSKSSDTVIFIEKYLSKLPNDFVKDATIMKLIENAIGFGNKFAFLNNQGESFICNAEEGLIEDGIWYSNDSYSYQNNIFFNNSCFDIFRFYRDLIDKLEYDELIYLGNSPLINLYEYTLEPFSIDKYKNTDTYISLKNFSKCLYQKYLFMYNDLQKILEKQNV